MNRHLIYQSYQEMLSLIRIECNYQNVWHQYMYKNMDPLFEWRRTNVRYNNVAIAKYTGLERDNRTAQ